MRKYNLETQKRAYELLDTGLPTEEVAEKLGVLKSAVSKWSTAKSRAQFVKQYGPTMQHVKELKRGPGRPKKVAPTTTPVAAPADGELAMLRAENAMLKRMLAEYWAREGR